MTPDEIMRLAIECQLVTTNNRDGLYAQALENFANRIKSRTIVEAAAIVLMSPNQEAAVNALENMK